MKENICVTTRPTDFVTYRPIVNIRILLFRLQVNEQVRLNKTVSTTQADNKADARKG